MSPIEKRLRATLAMDAINGDGFERAICAKQMAEAADEIDRLRAALLSIVRLDPAQSGARAAVRIGTDTMVRVARQSLEYKGVDNDI